jgi:hypothetical protein
MFHSHVYIFPPCKINEFDIESFKKEKKFKDLEKVCLRKRKICMGGVARPVSMFEL